VGRPDATIARTFQHWAGIYIVPCNAEYAILKEFALLKNAPNVLALDVPGVDIVTTAKGFGCFAVQAKSTEEIKETFTTTLEAEGPTVIAIPIAHQLQPLVPSAAD
jgi:benzoylformate decarboxylase